MLKTCSSHIIDADGAGEQSDTVRIGSGFRSRGCDYIITTKTEYAPQQSKYRNWKEKQNYGETFELFFIGPLCTRDCCYWPLWRQQPAAAHGFSVAAYLSDGNMAVMHVGQELCGMHLYFLVWLAQERKPGQTSLVVGQYEQGLFCQ